MTRALDLARRHAETCNAAETCAPTVSAPYLERAYRRMKLPIRAEWASEDGEALFHIWRTEVGGRRGYFPWTFKESAAEATRAYLRLCESLSEPAPSLLPAETGGAQTAGASAPAHSSRSAAVLPTDSPADSVPAPKDTGTLAPSSLIPGDGAPVPGAA